jgi:hypothetical protein
MLPLAVDSPPSVLSLLAIPVVLFLLMIVVSYFEKRLVSPFIEIDPERENPDVPIDLLSQYVEHMCDGAQAAGFQFGSMTAHRKYPKIKISGAVWISQDRRTLLNTGSGTIFGMPSKQTWLTSPRRDGTWLVTTDGNDEGDPSGRKVFKRVLNVRFEKLLATHQKRIDSDPAVAPFPPGRPFDLLCEYNRQINEEMLRRGISRPRDSEGQYWSYSLATSIGAISRVFKQVGSAIPQTFRVKAPPIASPELSTPAGLLLPKWRQSPGASS